MHEGGLLSRTRCALWVRPDGLITTPEMLCWAMEQRASPKRLNVHVLTEMTLEYFRLERSRIHSASTRPSPTAPGPPHLAALSAGAIRAVRDRRRLQERRTHSLTWPYSNQPLRATLRVVAGNNIGQTNFTAFGITHS